jgi:predicted acylesterase/phospholipase RssA
VDNVNSNDTSAPTTQPDIRKDIETKRVGLVLCGGGFKGAYQIGVWKALREIGFQKFDVIAGSSVGALNAVLVANGDVEATERVWQEINVMQWEPRSVGWYVSGYLLLFGPLIAST